MLLEKKIFSDLGDVNYILQNELNQYGEVKDLDFFFDTLRKDYAEEIGFFKNLRKLNLNTMHLLEIDPSVGKLVGLKELILANNYLTRLPDSLANLKSLETLWLSENQFSIVPEVIARLPNLKKLYLDVNNIVELPGFLLEKNIEFTIYNNPCSPK